LDVGYLGIDTGALYRNEAVVASAIRDSGKTGIFITTKLSPADMGYNEALRGVTASLDKLEVDTVDMLLVNWPGKFKLPPGDAAHRKARVETWGAFEHLYNSGKARSIGVANFTVKHIKDLEADGAQILPMVNQIEVHALLQQRDLIDFCRAKKIVTQGYGPFGSEGAPVLKEVGNFKIPPAAAALSIASSLADAIVLKSSTPSRIAENFEVLNSPFQFNEVEEELIKGLNMNKHYSWDPSGIV
jgi:diketogulonate reductase-like aldo/keto reductase